MDLVIPATIFRCSHQQYIQAPIMPDKITRQHNNNPTRHTVNDQHTTDKATKYANKRVSPAENKKYLESQPSPVQGQALNNRVVTEQNQEILLHLANEKNWTALSSAIAMNGKTVRSIERILDLFQQENITLPADLQNQISLQYGQLSALITMVTLSITPSEEPYDELKVLSSYTGGLNHPDSPAQIIAVDSIDKFLTTNKLENVDRTMVIQKMAGQLYGLILKRMGALQDIVYQQSNNAALKDHIDTARHEQRIELDYLRSIQINV